MKGNEALWEGDTLEKPECLRSTCVTQYAATGLYPAFLTRGVLRGPEYPDCWFSRVAHPAKLSKRSAGSNQEPP